jgi:hypothetical protein
MKALLKIVTAAALVLAGSSAAHAHHSGAMFDATKTVVLEGTVKEFQWTNPHTWIQIDVKDASGKDVEWAVEGGAPNGLARQGWSRASLKPGDKAAITVHPLRDGAAGGTLMSATVNGVLVGR